MKETELYFGTATVEKNTNMKETLNVDDYFGNYGIKIHDAEIANDKKSPELVRISTYEFAGKKGSNHEMYVHKKDCLQIASFLLNIHTEYANKVNSIKMKSYSEKVNLQSQSTQAHSHPVPYEDFKIEMDAKNQAYYFIISHGCFEEFHEFCKNYKGDDPHGDCIKELHD